MDSPSPPQRPMQDLARRLLAAEAATPCTSQLPSQAAVRVCDKLRISLTPFAGADGFASLLRRALAVARTEVPAIHNLQVRADGSLEGLAELAVDASSHENFRDGVDMGAEAGIALITHLLGLLLTFVGEPITLRLVREGWPDASWGEPNTPGKRKVKS